MMTADAPALFHSASESSSMSNVTEGETFVAGSESGDNPPSWEIAWIDIGGEG